MKEPKRLLSQGATDFERQLLRAVANERPSALLRSRMQRGLGLVGPLAWASTVKAMLGSVGGKITGIVALGVLAAAGVTAVNLVPSPGAGTDELAEPPVASAAPAAVSEPVAPTVEAPTTPSVALPDDASGAAAPATSPRAEDPSTAAAVAAPASDGEEQDRQLREEIALLDAARGALERGDRQAARDSLRAYRERFPSGVLAREANVLRRRAEPPRAHARPPR